jgi:hypothetical protein
MQHLLSLSKNQPNKKKGDSMQAAVQTGCTSTKMWSNEGFLFGNYAGRTSM